MHDADALLTLAEVALGIAGFVAIIVVLSPRSGSLAPGFLFLTRAMILNSLGVAGLALFPWVFTATGVSDVQVWRWSSGIYVLGALFVVFPLYIHEQRSLQLNRDAEVSRTLVAAWALAGIALFVHLANLSGWPFEPSFSAFYLGLLLALSVPAIVFIILVFKLLR